jgi:hypothetical protein
MEPDRQHFVTCNDCREFYREMINEDREVLKEDFRTIVKEEWQCSLTTIEDIKRLQINQRWLIISQLIQGLTIASFIFKNIWK